MNRYLRNIFSSFIFHRSKREKSRHFTDLVNGPKINIDGKSYVKVKLRFVDTLDFNTADYIDQLESMIESGKSEIEDLRSENEVFSQKIKDLQNLNVNLLRELNTKIKRNDLTIKEFSDSIRSKETAIEELSITIKNSNPIIEFLKEQVAALELRIKTKDNRIRSLEAELQNIKSSRRYSSISKKEIEKLKRNPDKSINPISWKIREMEEKDIVIKILSNREKDYQMKIENLKRQIDSLNKK